MLRYQPMQLDFIELLDRRWFRLTLLFVVTAFLSAAAGLADTVVGQWMAPFIGPEAEHGFGDHLVVGITLGAAIVLNTMLIGLLPFPAQLGVIWAELLILVLAFFDSFGLSYPFIWQRLPFLITQGAFTTIYVSLVAILLACVLAMAGALARLSRSGPAYGIATFYISFFRGTPLLLQVYLIYLGLPQLGYDVPAVPAGIAALALCYGAYMAEIFRAGIQSIPHGQGEAGLALGLHKGVIMRKIILPQAMRIIIPPTGNQFIAMLKDSSLISVIGVWDLMFLARTQGRSEFKHLEMLITAAIIYWLISIAFELIQARIERHYGKSQVR